MIRRSPFLAGLGATAAVSLLLAACGGGGGSSSTENASGQLRVSLTDSQSCNYESVFVTVTEVRVHRSSDPVAEDDEGWESLVLPEPLQVDLMTLRNGVAIELGTLPLEAGTYSQVRLVLASNDGPPPGEAPYANYLVLPGTPAANAVALKTPSAQQSGLKLNVQATIEPGQVADLVLDFDPCKSVVKAGKSGQYLLKPVVTAYLDLVNTVEGYTVPGALVSAQQDGASVKSTVADGSGRFVLWPIEAGTYDLVITAPAYATAVLEGVVVSDGVNAVSTQGDPLQPLPSAPAPDRQLGGKVTTGTPQVFASVRALQALDAKTIEVAAQPTATDGNYSFTLPTAAPGRAAWVSGTTTYAFTGFTSAAGLYRVEATAAGSATPQVLPVPPADPYDLTLGDVTDANFTFGP